ncbi:MAG: Signal transduction histidine kinase [Betaproteobacteria bacterium HGW-Betaproteobacteria-16]|nr:MAG: Signal transduction histidine kinase [Betaproteobacteria bacterium HGW-Betaproteobacteria-16]
MLLLLLIFLLAAFTALNWGVFVQPAELSFGVATLQLPFGLLMLGLLVAVALVFILFAIYVQTGALLEVRRHTRELQACRELAEKAEASRLSELRHVFEVAAEKQENRQQAFEARLTAEVAQLGSGLRVSMEESVNSLAACIGELEDRLERDRRS